MYKMNFTRIHRMVDERIDDFDWFKTDYQFLIKGTRGSKDLSVLPDYSKKDSHHVNVASYV